MATQTWYGLDCLESLLVGLAEQPYEFLVDIWPMGLVFLQLITLMNTKDLINFVRSNCADNYNFLNPGRLGCSSRDLRLDLVFVLQENLRTNYSKALEFYPSLIHMIAPTRDRKSAKELLVLRLGALHLFADHPH